MSLKVFHIIFISVSVLLFIGFGAWLIVVDTLGNSVLSAIAGLLSLGIGVGLLLYGRSFLRKFKHVSNL